MVTTVNVKVYSDRTLSINKKVFGGMQTDIGSVEIVWDVSDVYNGNQYSVEIFGAAGTYSKSIPLDVVYDEGNTSRSVTYEIPPELTEIGGQAVVYLIEEQIENEAVKRRVCTYPLRLYLPHRSASSNEVKVEEYNRQLTDMYLAVVCARVAMETLNKDSANNLADAKAKLDKAILDYNRAIEVATGGINFGSGMKDFNIGDTYFGVEILNDNTYCVFVDGEYFAFDDNGAIRLSDEYLSSLSRQFDEKQFAFELNPDEALEFAEGENGKSVLRLKSSAEIYQDADGLHLNLGDGLKRTDDGYRIEVDSDVIPDKEYVNSLMSGALKRKVCEDGLPKENIDINTVYMVPAEESAENNIYNEFMNINGKWEMIGSTAVDLSDYVRKSSVDEELSSESSNPVQNKAVAEALNEANAITRQLNEKINKNSNGLLELGEKKADKENDWTKEPIITVTCDGTQHFYSFTGLNLDAMILVFEATTAGANQSGRVSFNNREGITDLYFGSYLSNGGARYTMAYVDLKRKFAVRGVSVDKSGITLQTDTAFTEVMLKGEVEVINKILFQSFASVIIPNGSVIKIYGREKV